MSKRTLWALGVATLAAGGSVLIRCVGDDSGVVDAGTKDSSIADVVANEAAPPNDAGSDVVVEAEAPCVDGGAPYVSQSGGVQCYTDGGFEFCGTIQPTECCGKTTGALMCVAQAAGCGTDIPFECDTANQCDAGRCCMKTPSLSTQCPGRVFTSGGTYCSANGCPSSDVTICNGSAITCGVQSCLPIQLEDFPGKILSGCF